ncbi:MAG TPA: hypothetical protein VHP36_08260, partial [Chitinispirillaceae bacterium]|nr:hypothetical protein [Chitinispirillaceae bacterium]
MFTSYQILQVDSIELLDQMISTSLGQNLQMPAESSATAVNDNNRTEIASYGVPQKSKQYNNSSPLSGYSYLTNKTHSE